MGLAPVNAPKALPEPATVAKGAPYNTLGARLPLAKGTPNALDPLPLIPLFQQRLAPDRRVIRPVPPAMVDFVARTVAAGQWTAIRPR